MQLIGMMGYAGAGKDAVAEILHDFGFIRIAYADRLKAVARAIGWNGDKDDAGRRLLQDLGVAVREHVDGEAWVTAAHAQIHLSPNRRYVISDVRFPNEIDAIKKLGGQLWRVDRPGVGPVNGHISETAWNGYEPDRVIHNAGTLADLRDEVGWLLTGVGAATLPI